ncbi:MAG: hypothetical protein VKK04_26005 [Synechococcales bacterium]|nr:hypothetical protein [Synechococcales bacterium]
MGFPKFLMTSSVLAGVTFCSTTLPLVALGSSSLGFEVQRGEDPIFIGQLEDVAAPYLGFATAISLGVGAISLTTMGWSHTSKKLSASEDQMQALRRQLQEKEGLIESLQFSETRLEAAGLTSFMEEDEFYLEEDDLKKLAIASTSETDSPAAARSVSLEPSQELRRPAPAPNWSTAQPQPTASLSEDPAQLNELLGQLKVVMARVEKLHVVESDRTGSSNHAAPAA